MATKYMAQGQEAERAGKVASCKLVGRTGRVQHGALYKSSWDDDGRGPIVDDGRQEGYEGQEYSCLLAE